MRGGLHIRLCGSSLGRKGRSRMLEGLLLRIPFLALGLLWDAFSMAEGKNGQETEKHAIGKRKDLQR